MFLSNFSLRGADVMGVCLLNFRLVFLAISAAALDYKLIEQGQSFKSGMKGMNSILAAGLDLSILAPYRIDDGTC